MGSDNLFAGQEMNPDFRDALFQLLQHTFGTRVEIIQQTVANRAHGYLVLLLTLRHPSQKIVVKLAGPESPLASSFDRTAMFLRLVAAQTSIPVPDVIALNMSYQVWPWRYMIKTYLPGREWAALRPRLSQAELAGAYGEIGAAVAQLHSIQFPAFGELEPNGKVSGAESYLSAFKRRAHRSIKSESMCALFLSALDGREQLFADIQSARLCHEDLHHSNILFRHHRGKWRLATILDFDKAWAGHAEIDLARLEFWRGMTSPEFWSAYQASMGSMGPSYAQRRPIYQLGWCLEYARLTPQHLSDTQGLCDQLGLSFPGKFA